MEPDVPRDDVALPDLPDEDEGSPARAAATRWWKIWVDAAQIQNDTGRHGTLTDWESGLDFSTHAAATTHPQLLADTRDSLKMLADFFEQLESVAPRLEALVHECPPLAGGALLHAAETIRRGLGLTSDADIRDMHPPLDPAVEQRLAHQDEIISYWAAFAAGRTREINELREIVVALVARLDATPEAGCCGVSPDVLTTGEKVRVALARTESLVSVACEEPL